MKNNSIKSRKNLTSQTSEVDPKLDKNADMPKVLDHSSSISASNAVIAETAIEAPAEVSPNNGDSNRCGPNISIRRSDPFKNFLFRQGIADLFTILIGIGATISLLPVFLDFFIGSNWLNVFLKDFPGFIVLLCMITAVLCGLVFMLIILLYIIHEFIVEVSKPQYPKSDIFLATFFLMFGVISFFCIFDVLLSVWWIKAIEQKFDIILLFSVLIIFLTIGTVLGIVIYISEFSKELTVLCQTIASPIFNRILMPICQIIKKGYLWVKNYISSRISKNSKIRTFPRRFVHWITPHRKSLLIAIIPIVVIIILLYFFSQALIPIYALISNYYNETDKTIDVTLEHNQTAFLKDSPDLLNITYTLKDTNHRLGDIDYSYLECQWTTNYGYFIKINPKSHKIEQKQDVISITPCPLEGNIFWTDGVSDFGEKKPDVFISLVVKDSNKDLLYGNSHLYANWTNNNTIVIENLSFS